MPPADRSDVGEEHVSRWCVSEEDRPFSAEPPRNPGENFVEASSGDLSPLPPPYSSTFQHVCRAEGPACHYVEQCSPIVSFDEKNTGGDDDGSDGERYMWVLDPHSRKLRVPVSLLVPTHATANKGALPSLCLAFLEGHCRHEWCRQAHVPPHVLPMLRQQALNVPTCCRLHKDPHSTSELTDRFKFIQLVGNEGSCDGYRANGELGNLIPAERVALTVGLQLIIAQSVHAAREKEDQSLFLRKSFRGVAKDMKVDPREVLDVPAKDVCRLHISRLCRYLEDCKNIHICREFELQLPPPPNLVSLLNGITPTTTIINIGERSYSSTMISSGEVTDEAFGTICDQQRSSLIVNNATTEPLSVPLPNPYTNTVTSCGNFNMSVVDRAASPLSLGDANSYTVPRGCVSPSGCGTLDLMASTHASELSPWVSRSSAATASASTGARVLRIFDVRPKPLGDAARERLGSHRSPNQRGNGSLSASPYLNSRGPESVPRPRNGAGASYTNCTCPNGKNGNSSTCVASAAPPPSGSKGNARIATSGGGRRGNRQVVFQTDGNGRGSSKRRQKT